MSSCRVKVFVKTRAVTRVVMRGPQGRPGSPGYDHQQASPSTLWTIAHNLGLRPSVQAFSVGGVEMIGTVQHLSANTLTISFNIAVAGYARLV